MAAPYWYLMILLCCFFVLVLSKHKYLHGPALVKAEAEPGAPAVRP